MKLKKKAILYAEGKLDRKKRKKFEKKLEKKPDIRNSIKVYKWLDAELRILLSQKNASANDEKKIQDHDIQNDINRYLKNYETADIDREKEFLKILNKSKPSINYSLILNIAASLLFIFILISASFHFSRKKSNKEIAIQLFKENFNPHKDMNISNIKSPYVEVNNEGKLKFSAVAKYLGNSEMIPVTRNGSLKKKDALMISLALIENEEFAMAQQYLEDILEEQEHRVKETARWYLALIELKLENYDKAIENLKVLCANNSSYKNSSCSILKTLKEKNIE